MKPTYRSILVLTATITAVSLYAYLGPDPKEKKAEEQLEAVVATASVHTIENGAIDQLSGLPILKMGTNELVYTADIREAVASKLMEQLVAAGFFGRASSHKMIVGREPNSYIIFFTLNISET